MADHDPAPVSEPAAVHAERRAFVRLTTDRAVTCRTAVRQPDIGWPGRARDISRGGVGLLLRHRFEPGTVLTVELRDDRGQLMRTVTVRVVHATAAVDGASPCWLLGCAFDRPLDPADLAALA